MEEDSDEGQRSDQPSLLKSSTVSRLPQQPEAKPHITHRRFKKQRMSGPKHRSCNMTALQKHSHITS